MSGQTQIRFAGDPVPTDLDASLHEAAADAAKAKKPISMAVTPEFYWYSKQTRLPWRRVIWYVTDTRPEVFIQFRLALTTFFRVCGLVGPGRVGTLLRLIDDNPALLDQFLGAPVRG